MLLENDEISKRVLELFTLELIKNSNQQTFLEIKRKLEEKEKLAAPIQFTPIFPTKIPQKQKTPLFSKRPIRKLTIPEPKLPERFKYLRPAPKSVAIDLGKLNRFLIDPKIRTIECSGANEPILLNAHASNEAASDVMLSKEELDDVIKTFSVMSKIPAEEGPYKVIVGNLMFTAIISETIGSRFIIRKMNQLPPQMFRPARR